MDFKVNKIANDTEENRLLNRLLTSSVCEGFVEIEEEKFVLPLYFMDNWEKINQFEVRDDDVFITGHPKTGTTWASLIIDMIFNDFQINYNKKYHPLYLDIPLLVNVEKTSAAYPFHIDAPKFINVQNSPRLIRTHLPWFLLPQQIRNGIKSPKIIHCLRNPKDTCISYYHFIRGISTNQANFDDFCKLFLKGKVVYGPFSANVKSYWKERERPNLFFMKYSDLKKDLAGTIRKTVEFLGRTATKDQVNKMVEYLKFDTMKKNFGSQLNEFINYFATTQQLRTVQTDFVRVGEEGGYKSVMSKELIEEFDAITQREFSGIEFNFE